MPCVGKTTAADVIAKKFELVHLAGGDMLKEMAIERGYSPSGSDWWDKEEGMNFLRERRSNPEFDREVDKRLTSKVQSGGVVVTSYTVPWLCKQGLKLWFDASPDTRAIRLAGRDSITKIRARKIIKQRDERNRRLYKRIYKIDFGRDLSVFNYIVDTEEMTKKQVAETAANLVKTYYNARKS